MPKRSNEFQQLVLLLQQQLANNDSTVTESQLLRDRGTRSDVEVDVLVELKAHNVCLSIGFECTAEGRPATVEWVREMWGKHASLSINQTVLVSRNGFTSEAERFADSKNTLTMTLDKAVSAEWSSWLESMTSLRIAAVTFTPVDLTVRVVGASEAQVATVPETRVRWPTLGVEATVKGYWASILRRPDVFPTIMRKWLTISPQERQREFSFALDLKPDPSAEIATVNGEWKQIQLVKTRVNATVRDTAAQFAAGQLGGVEFAYAEVPNIFTNGGTKYVLVNMLAEGGRLKRASLLIPASSSGEAEVRHMRLADN